MGTVAGTVSVAAPRALLGVLAERGIDDARLARAAGVDIGALRADQGSVPFGTVLQLLDASAAALSDPLFGAHLAHDYRPGYLGLIDYLFLTSATLREALDVTIRFHAVAADYGEWAQAEAPGGRTFRRVVPAGPGADQAEAFVLSWQLFMARFGTGARIRPLRIALSHAASPAQSVHVAAVFGTEDIRFGAPAAAMTFSDADLDRPLLGGDPVLARTLRQHAVSRRVLPSWPERTREVLLRRLGEGRALSLVSTAAEFAVSPRTLQQRLQAEGTTWQHESDEVRNETAAALLREEKFTIAAIADQVGYSDARAFRRAFRQRNGCSPHEYRDSATRGNYPL